MSPRVLPDPEPLGPVLSFVFVFVATAALIVGVVVTGRRLLR